MMGVRLLGTDDSRRHAAVARLLTTLLVGGMALFLVACGTDGDGATEGERPNLTLPEESPDASPPEAEAPETEAPPQVDPPQAEAPDPPAPDDATAQPAPAPTETSSEGDGDADSEVPIAVWVVLGLVVVALVGWLAARLGSRSGSKESDPQPAPTESWRSAARLAYADARWLYDELDPSLARWRGDILYDAGQAQGAPTDTSKQGAWNRIPARMDSARESLYRVEGAAPDAEVSRLAKALLDQLAATRGAVDALADAHRARRVAEADMSPSEHELSAARSAESRAESALDSRRHALHEAILNLSAAT